MPPVATAAPPRQPDPPALDQLWDRMTSEQRLRTLVTLSGILVRQLDAARDEREVHDERS